MRLEYLVHLNTLALNAIGKEDHILRSGKIKT